MLTARPTLGSLIGGLALSCAIGASALGQSMTANTTGFLSPIPEMRRSRPPDLPPAPPATMLRTADDPFADPTPIRTASPGVAPARTRTWYDDEYGGKPLRYYRFGGPGYRISVEVPVVTRRPAITIGGTRQVGPYQRNRYLFYERDRRFNSVPFPGGGGGYNVVW